MYIFIVTSSIITFCEDWTKTVIRLDTYYLHSDSLCPHRSFSRPVLHCTVPHTKVNCFVRLDQLIMRKTIPHKQSYIMCRRKTLLAVNEKQCHVTDLVTYKLTLEEQLQLQPLQMIQCKKDTD